MRFFLFLCLSPSVVFANTGASALGATVFASIFLFPLIVIAEWLFYRNRRIRHPFRTSIILNVMSSFIGNILALIIGGLPGGLITGVFWIDPARGPARPWALPLAFAFHYGLSVFFEHAMARMMKYELTLKTLCYVHALSYGVLIGGLYLFRWGTQFLR